MQTNQDKLNLMWRNGCINDTYEPGSTFKIITTAAAFEEGVVSLKDRFHCPGYKIVEDRKIRCHKVGGHGAEDFAQGIMNSCNPVFIELGLRLGSEKKYYSYFKQFGLLLQKDQCGFTGRGGNDHAQSEKISGRWSWRPYPSDSLFRSHRSS